MPGLDFLIVATPQLKAYVEQLEHTLSPENHESFIRYLHTLSDGYRSELEAAPPGPGRARAMHRLLERELASATELPHSCSKGCGACCHLEVEITRDEGELLAQMVVDGHSVDHARLRKQAMRARKDEAWALRLIEDNRCVFLDSTDSCSIYESRPGVCRKVLVTSPAAYCSDPSQNAEPISIPLAELILSTALSLPDNPYASISKSVARGLQRLGHLEAMSQEIPLHEGPASPRRPVTAGRGESGADDLVRLRRARDD